MNPADRCSSSFADERVPFISEASVPRFNACVRKEQDEETKRVQEAKRSIVESWRGVRETDI